MLPPPSLEGGPHFFICDQTGNCAVIEYLEGKMIYYSKAKMPVKVLSNDRYDECISNLDMYKSWGGDMPVPQSGSSYDRFVRASDMVKNYDPQKSKSIDDYTFSILENVKWSTPTQWSIVYDLRNLRVHYYTIDNNQVRDIDLNAFNFSCKTPVKLLDINAALFGDVTKKFTDYSYERNRDDIKKVLEIPEEALNVIARYPETTICTE
jgi:choloylglycine hydrolase